MSSTPVIAVTGANGYVGGVIARGLAKTARVVRLVRVPQTADDVVWSFATDIEATAKIFREQGVTCLVHAAWDMKANGQDEVRRTCVEGSERLFAAAKQAGIDTIVFISTISAFDGARSVYGRAKVAVERLCASAGGVTLRLGLVYGSGDGGVFGNLRHIARNAKIIPLIGNGRAPQYLLDEESLAQAVHRAAFGEFAGQTLPITLANPKPIPFRDLLQDLAGAAKTAKFLPLPWLPLYIGLRCAELIGLKLNFRSDSVISFVFQNPAPDFYRMNELKLTAREFHLYDAKES